MAYGRIEYSCPHFDEAIAEIEKARDVNRRLRENADEFESERDDLKSENEKLTDRVSELESEIKSLEKTIAQMEQSA